MLEGSVSKKKAVVLLVIVGVVALVAGTFIVSETNYYEDNYSLEDSCNVLALSANGILSTYIPEQTTDDWSDVSSSEYITDGILSAQNDQEIKAEKLLENIGKDLKLDMEKMYKEAGYKILENIVI